MRKELRKQIELLEQKMSKSPNNMKDGGSHFLYRRERAKNACKKIKPNRELYLKTHYR